MRCSAQLVRFQSPENTQVPGGHDGHHRLESRQQLSRGALHHRAAGAGKKYIENQYEKHWESAANFHSTTLQTLTSLNALGNKIKYLPIEIGGRTSLKDLQVDQVTNIVKTSVKNRENVS